MYGGGGPLGALRVRYVQCFCSVNLSEAHHDHQLPKTELYNMLNLFERESEKLD